MYKALATIEPASAPQSGVIACGVYAEGKRIADISVDEVKQWASRDGHIVWIGLYEPTPAVLAKLQTQLGLHELAVEDAGKPHQRPKIEQYGEDLFIVARTAQVVDRHIRFGVTAIFLGKGYVVSVRHGASTSYTPVRERLEANPKLLSHGEDYILYAILDFIVDNYVPVVAEINDEVEEIEGKVINEALSRQGVRRLHKLRRDLLRLRNAATPLVDVCRRLEHADVRTIDPAMQHLFRDVTDHVRRVQEDIDALREVLAFAFEASLMNGQAQQVDVTRKLAAWAAILAVPTAIAGIYGMNFEHMPELTWQYGYYAVVAVILLLCGLLFSIFRRNRWL